MEAAITILLTLIQGLVPVMSGGSATGTIIGGVITSLENLVPIVVSGAPQFISTIQGIIADLQASNAPITQAQLTALDSLSAQCDAAFEAANAAAGGPAAPTS